MIYILLYLVFSIILLHEVPKKVRSEYISSLKMNFVLPLIFKICFNTLFDDKKLVAAALAQHVFQRLKGLHDGPLAILTGGRQAQTPPIPVRPVYSNSRSSVDPQGNRLCIMFTSLV